MTAPTTPSPERQPADAGGWSDWPRKSQDMRYEIGARPGGDAWAFCPYCDNSIDQTCDVTIVSHDGSLALAHSVCIPDECRSPAPQAQPDARSIFSEDVGTRFLQERLVELAELFDVPDGGRYLNDWRARADQIKALSAPAADDGWRDKAEGLESDLRYAVQVAWRRGAKEWARLNYPQYIDWLEACGDAWEPAAPTDDHYKGTVNEGKGCGGRSRIIDEINALHPAAPTDEVGK